MSAIKVFMIQDKSKMWSTAIISRGLEDEKCLDKTKNDASILVAIQRYCDRPSVVSGPGQESETNETEC